MQIIIVTFVLWIDNLFGGGTYGFKGLLDLFSFVHVNQSIFPLPTGKKRNCDKNVIPERKYLYSKSTSEECQQ